MTNKDNKRRAHAEKILQKNSKQAGAAEKKDESSQSAGNKSNNLRAQYDVIKQDVMRLKDDLLKGYDMAREMVDVKSFKGLLKAK